MMRGGGETCLRAARSPDSSQLLHSTYFLNLLSIREEESRRERMMMMTTTMTIYAFRRAY
jgi:hypothetical protein